MPKPTDARLRTPGPFKVAHLRVGDPYELSQGHAVYCAPSGRNHSRTNLVGASVLDTDPKVDNAGVDTGVQLSENTLRAPDVVVGVADEGAGFATTAPPLAVEYADRGQDEADLQRKIVELLGAGTRWIWVVRLTGPRRVEVYERGSRGARTHGPGELLHAKGVLANAVPVEALYDRSAAHEATLRNLLQRRGYDSVDAIREEGRAAEARRALVLVLQSRGLKLTAAQRRTVESCSDVATLERWLTQAVTAASVSDALKKPRR